MTLQDELRRFANELRRTSMKLEDLIPLLQKAADKLDQLESNNNVTQAQAFCAQTFNKN